MGWRIGSLGVQKWVRLRILIWNHKANPGFENIRKMIRATMIMIWTVYGNGGREEFLEGWLKKEKEITEIKSPDELEPTHHRRPEGEERGDSRWDDPQAAAATRPAEMEAHPAEDGEGEKAGMGGGLFRMFSSRTISWPLSKPQGPITRSLSRTGPPPTRDPSVRRSGSKEDSVVGIRKFLHTRVLKSSH